MDYNKLRIEAMKARYPVGTRVELGYMEGEPDMPSGIQGTVEFIDDASQIHVAWSNGRTLAINCKVDRFKKVRESDRKLVSKDGNVTRANEAGQCAFDK